MLIRLKVQVRCAHVDGIDQHLVQEFDNGSIFYVRSAAVLVLLLGSFLGIVELEFVVCNISVQRFRDAFVCALNESDQFVVLGNDPVNAHLRGKFDFFRGFLVGGGRRGHDQAVAALAQRQHMVAGAQLGVEQILGQQQRVNGVQIQQWRAEDQRDLVG